MQYFIVKPDASELEITNDVLRGANNITEFVFDLNDFVIPSDVNIIVSNNQGGYSPEVEIFRDFDINQLFVRIADDLGNLLFIGILADIKYNLNQASFKITNVITQLLGQSVTGFSMTATPSEIVHKLLRLASISETLLDNEGFKRLNFMFSSLTDLETAYPTNVDAAARTVDFDLLSAQVDADGNQLYAFVSGKHVFKEFAEQTLVVSVPEETPIIDIIKEIVGLSGMLVYTEKGVFTARLYPFGADYYATPQEISSDSVEAASIKYSRPLPWRRAEVTAPYFDGVVKKANLKASDIAFSDSGFLENIFSAKPVEFDGLDNQIYHEDLDSITNALNSILLLRAPARYHSEFNLSLATDEGVSLLPSIDLFKPVQVEFPDHCINGLGIQIRKLDDKFYLKLLSANERYVFRTEIDTQIDNYEAGGNRSFYPQDLSALTFAGITVEQSTAFFHRNNRANPAFLKFDTQLVLLNNTDFTIQVDYEYSTGSGSDVLAAGGFVEIATTDNLLLSLTVTYITDCGNLSERYTNVRPLIVPPSDNLLLTNYCTTLITDNDGIISQVDN